MLTHLFCCKKTWASDALHPSVVQGGITCGAIEDPRKSSKAIDERVIINFRDKNVVIARFRDKNVVIARFCDKNVVIARFRDKNVVIATKQRMFGWEYYPLKSA